MQERQRISPLGVWAEIIFADGKSFASSPRNTRLIAAGKWRRVSDYVEPLKLDVTREMARKIKIVFLLSVLGINLFPQDKTTEYHITISRAGEFGFPCPFCTVLKGWFGGN